MADRPETHHEHDTSENLINNRVVNLSLYRRSSSSVFTWPVLHIARAAEKISEDLAVPETPATVLRRFSCRRAYKKSTNPTYVLEKQLMVEEVQKPFLGTSLLFTDIQATLILLEGFERLSDGPVGTVRPHRFRDLLTVWGGDPKTSEEPSDGRYRITCLLMPPTRLRDRVLPSSSPFRGFWTR